VHKRTDVFTVRQIPSGSVGKSFPPPAFSATPTPYRGGFVMTLTLPGLIVMIVIAAICGAVGKALAGGTQGGLVVSITLGFIGALFGPWVAGQLNLAEPFMLHVSGQPFPIVWSIIGAALFVALVHLVSGRRWVRA
jgi:uncharacterized membrane protein YeaQ/YmgE (transglycosylase-associated protein family)